MNPMSATRFHPNQPRIYSSAVRVPAFWIAGLDVAALVILELLRSAGLITRRSSNFDAVFTIGLLLLIMLWIGIQGDQRVIITDDSIEVRNWFSGRKLAWKEIRGRTMRRSGDQAGQYVILPTNNQQKPLTLPILREADNYFFAFIRSIPKVKR